MTLTNEIVYLTPDNCWFDAPRERTGAFFDVFWHVSRALQLALRREIPGHLFQDANAYEKLEEGYAVVVYRASRPFNSRCGSELTYDVLEEAGMEKLFRLAGRSLPEVLATVHAELLAAGRPDIAKNYQPRHAEEILRTVRSNRRFRKPLYQILISEGRLLSELAALGGMPFNTKLRARRKGQFAKAWNGILRRIYGSRDIAAAGTVILRAVTEALVAAQWPAPADSAQLDFDRAA